MTSIDFQLDGLTEDVQSSAEQELRAYIQVFSKFPELKAIRRIVIPADFSAFVRCQLREKFGQDVQYSRNRTLGVVAAKTMHRVIDGELQTTLVFGNDGWAEQHDADRLLRWQLIAHELTHVIRDVRRFKSDPVAWDAQPEGFRAALTALIHSASEEYFVNKAVDAILMATVSDGEGEPIGSDRMVTEVTPMDYAAPAYAVIDEMRDIFLKNVTDFKTGQITIVELWDATLRYLEELLVALAHMAGVYDGSDRWAEIQAELTKRENYRFFMSSLWPALVSIWSGDGALDPAEELEHLLEKCGLTFKSDNYLAVDWTPYLHGISNP